MAPTKSIALVILGAGAAAGASVKPRALAPRQLVSGQITAISPDTPLTTCNPTYVQWQWSGDNITAYTVAIYIQTIATYTGGEFSARRALPEHSITPIQLSDLRNRYPSTARMHQVKRRTPLDSSSLAHSHRYLTRRELSAGETTRLLAQGVSLVSQAWVWPAVDVPPGLYRFVIDLQGYDNSVYGSTPVFAVGAGDDMSCVQYGSTAAATATTSSASSPTVWGIAPAASTSVSATSPMPSLSSATPILMSPAPSSVINSLTTSSLTSNSTSSFESAAADTASSGIHGPIIAAIVILPLAALIAIGMGMMHWLKRPKEQRPGSYVRTVPSSGGDNDGGAAGSLGAGAWASRFLAARAASRDGELDDADDDVDEKVGDNRASVFSDVCGGVDPHSLHDDETLRHAADAEARTAAGRRSMADISLADSPYIHCQSVTPLPEQHMMENGRPSMTSLRTVTVPAPLPLIVEDRPTGRSYDLPRGMDDGFNGTAPLFSPTETEREGHNGGWIRHAAHASTEDAHALTRDEVNTFAAGSDSARSMSPTHAGAAAAHGRSASRSSRILPLRLSGSASSRVFGNNGGATSPTLTAESSHSGRGEMEMAFPDTPQPYTARRLGGQGVVAEEKPSSPPSGREAYASLSRSGSNGSLFGIRRKPVPAVVRSPVVPSTTAAASGPFSDEHESTNPPSAPSTSEFPATPEMSGSSSSSSASSPAAMMESAEVDIDIEEEEEDQQQARLREEAYKLSVNLGPDALRFSGF